MTRYSFTLEITNPQTFGRSLYGSFDGSDGLTRAHIAAEKNLGPLEQGTFEDAEAKLHAHIMEFRDGEIYNDIYLLPVS